MKRVCPRWAAHLLFIPPLLVLVDGALLVAVAVADPLSALCMIAPLGAPLPIYLWLRGRN